MIVFKDIAGTLDRGPDTRPLLSCSAQWFPPSFGGRHCPEPEGNPILWVTGQLCTGGMVGLAGLYLC